MLEYDNISCTRGFHVYRDIWNPIEGEILDTKRENNNPMDKYAIAVIKDGVVVGHVPRKISKVVAFFLKHGGTLKCIVTGKYRYSEDTDVGGLEIPCIMKFNAAPRLLEKLTRGPQALTVT